MRHGLIHNILILSLLACLFAGCTSKETSQPSGKFDGNYKLVKLQGVTVTEEAPLAFIQIRDDSIFGKAIVNQWTAQIRNKRIGNLAYSKHLSNANVQQLEARLISVFQNSEISRSIGGKLSIQRNGETLAQFREVR